MKLAGVAAKYTAKYFLGFLAVFICSVLVAAVAKGSIENYIVERAENGHLWQQGVHDSCLQRGDDFQGGCASAAGEQ